jgi:glycine betaine/proline transport system substrate-binding protein
MQEGGIAVDYLKSRVFPGEIMNEMLVYMNENQATGEDAAYHFLETYPEIWTGWVSEEAAEGVKSEL